MVEDYYAGYFVYVDGYDDGIELEVTMYFQVVVYVYTSKCLLVDEAIYI